MTFLSPEFLCFFPIVAAVWFLLPRGWKNPWLLLSSWFFYFCASPVYLAFLLCTVLVTYFGALALERRHLRGVLALLLVVLFGALFLFKYLNFALSLAARALGALGFSFTAPALSLLLPVGISFYLFQAAGYLIDVYRGKVRAERRFLHCALFLSFFPQLVSGPINRAGELLPQFDELHPFCYDNLRQGLVRFLWGAFQKLVVADRLAVLVNTVFGAPEQFGAVQLMGAAACFSIQLYCDFAGYSNMALATAHVMGFTMRENFRAPLLARSSAELWRRWHISLSSWFRDYLYIPLGGSRKGTGRKWINVLIVFAVSGLWHGAALTFLVWGVLNGLYQVVGGVTAPARQKVRSLCRLREDGRLTAVLQVGITFVFFSLAMVFFKAGSLRNALDVLTGMVHAPLWQFVSMGLDKKELLCAAAGILVLLFVDVRSLKHELWQEFLSAKRWVRWVILWCLLFSVVVFGTYGAGYDAQSFIYGFTF